MDTAPTTLIRYDGIGGEVVVRLRHRSTGDVYELIVNGTFLMDTAETSTERLFADALLTRHSQPERVLVAGLGFGFTAAGVLADDRVRHVDIVEIEPGLVDVLRAGLVPDVRHVLADPRVRVIVDDVRSALPTLAPSGYDGILLDVDNGPDFLVHQDNAEVYAPAMLATADRALRPGGILGVWSAAPAPAFAARMAAQIGAVEHLTRVVRREGRDVDYHLYLAAASRSGRR